MHYCAKIIFKGPFWLEISWDLLAEKEKTVTAVQPDEANVKQKKINASVPAR